MTQPRRRARNEGFTLLEVMMTLAIMMVALMGIVALERAAVRANIESRTTAVATANNERWAGNLRRDAMRWTADLSAVSGFEYLDETMGTWVIPSGGDPFAVDWYGVPTTDATSARFCTVVRLRAMNPNHSMRADIVTFWAAVSNPVGSGAATFQTLCVAGNGANAAAALFDGTPTSALRHVRSTLVLRRVPP